MSGNTDSRGFAIDHDGFCLEDGIPAGSAPFAVSGAVLQELFTGSGRDNSAHLEAEALGNLHGTKPSSCGGIPFEDTVTVEDYNSSDDEPLSPAAATRMCENNTSATVHAMLKTSKFERDELFKARSKLSDVLKFLSSKGFSEEMIFEELNRDGFGTRQPVRDDFGLPVLPVGSSREGPNPFVDKMKGKLDFGNARVVFDEKAQKVNDFTIADQVAEKSPDASGHTSNPEPTKTHSWAEVVHKHSTDLPITFDFVPLKAGSKVVSPPKEILLKGNDKLKLSLVGFFSKGFLPYKKVAEFARKAWEKFGLQHVAQKDERTYVFRFADDGGMNNVLN